MTPDKRGKLNRFLAEKVLGWEQLVDGRYCERSTGEVWYEPLNYCHSWADCEPLLDKIEQDEQHGWRWAWTKDRAELYRFIVMGATGSPMYSAYAENRTEALCLAIAKAYGWEEDA